MKSISLLFQRISGLCALEKVDTDTKAQVFTGQVKVLWFKEVTLLMEMELVESQYNGPK